MLAGIAAGAATAGALVGALALQSGSGAAQLLSTRFRDLEGRQRRLVELRGTALLCNFWATWCAPCREEIPLLVAAKQQYFTRGLEVVGIAIDTVAKVRDFAANYRVNYPLFIAGSEGIEVMRGLGNHAGALPYSVLVDRRGAVVEHKLGAFSEHELQRALERLLG